MKRLLCFLMASTLLIGCSSGSTSTTASNTTSSDSTANQTTATQEAQATTEPEQSSAITYGSSFDFDGFTLYVGDSFELVPFDNTYADKDFNEVVKVPVSVTNNNEESGSVNMFFMKYFGSKGTELDSVSAYYMDDGIEFAGELRKGASYDVYFYMPYDGDGTYYIDFDNFSEKIELELPVTK